MRSPFSLLSKSFLDASSLAQPCTNYKCMIIANSRLQPDHKLHLYKNVLGSIHEVLAYDSWPSSIGLSRDMWHCVVSVYGKALFETVWFLTQKHWSVPRHVTLWQKMAEDACNIASHLSIDRTHDKRGILRQARLTRQSRSRHARQSPKLFKLWSEKSFRSLVQEFFGCKQPGTAMYRLQVYMGKVCWKPHDF